MLLSFLTLVYSNDENAQPKVSKASTSYLIRQKILGLFPSNNGSSGTQVNPKKSITGKEVSSAAFENEFLFGLKS